MKKGKGLNAFQLKLIAVAAMICDHIAWAFVDEFSALGQIMHTIGRITIPTMCFFIAEGLRHTSDLKKYIMRLTAGWLISIAPFYMFFHEMYDYRQNIIFDLLNSLLVAALISSEKASKTAKIFGTIGLFAVSAAVGGWPVLPIIFVLIFYFISDKKKRTLTLFAVNTVFVTLLTAAIALNQTLHFSSYPWVWYEKLYLYGFSLALIPLWFYNGERGFSETKGRRLFGKYFFYAVYPLHLLILSLLRTIVR